MYIKQIRDVLFHVSGKSVMSLSKVLRAFRIFSENT